jgi:hypothetical protein
VFFALLLSCGGGVYGSPLQEDNPDRECRDSVYRRVIEDGVLTLSCHFAYTRNSSDINTLLKDNLRELGRLDAFIRTAVSDTALCVRRIRLSGYSSIEGTYAVNERLARDRARIFRNYLDVKYRLSEKLPVDVSWVAEDWSGLYDMVFDARFDGREETLRLIETVDIFRGRETLLMRVRGGRVYNLLLNQYFPRLRRVEIRVEYDLQRMLQRTYSKTFSEQDFERALEQERARLREEIRHEVKESLPPIDTVITYPGGKFGILGLGEIYSITHTEEERPAEEYPAYGLRFPAWAVKTNVLQLAGFARGVGYTAPLFNLSVERFFTRAFSVEVGMDYANHPYNKGKEFQGLTGYRIEPRFRLKHRRSFPGFYLGAYAQAGDFNLRTLRTDTDLQTGNLTGKYYEAGLSGGFYIPLSRHWGFDAGVRGGYRRDKGIAYEVEDDGNHYLYDRIERSLRLSAVILSVSYRIYD